MAVNKRTKEAGESLGFLLVAGLILVVLNVLGVVWFERIDCTQNRLFSLSDGSERLASSLTDTLEVTAYFTEDLPPPFNATERYVRDLLAEYTAASRGKIRVRFVNPDTEEEEEQAREAGVQRVAHQVIENDSLAVREGYRGLVMRYLDKKETLPVIEDTSGLEYQLTTALKKMLGEKAKVAVVSGFGGPTPTEGLATLRTALPTYELIEVEAGELDAEQHAAALLVGVDQTIPETTLKAIDAYLMQGGSLGVFGGTMKVGTEAGLSASPVDTGINTLLTRWGVRMRNGIVADAVAARAPLRTSLGFNVPVAHPPLPRVTFDESQQEHPVLFRLPASVFPFVAPIAVNQDTVKALEGVDVTVLAATSETSWVLDEPTIDLQPRDPRSWRGRRDGPFPIMVAIEGLLPSAFSAEGMSTPESAPGGAPDRATKEARVLVVGGSFMLRDEALPQPDPQTGQTPMNAGVAFALNAVDWLAQDSDLIAIRAKSVEDPPIRVPSDVRAAQEKQEEAKEEAIAAAEQGDEAGVESAVAEANRAEEEAKTALDAWEVRKGLYRWGNMLGIPAAFALFGVIRWQIRKRKRQSLKI